MLNQLAVSSVIGSRSVSTGPLSAVLSAAAFVDLPYSPALLLDSSFSANITDNPEFHKACKYGFDAYFEDMYELDEEYNETFVEKRYSWAEVATLVGETVWSIGLRDWRRVPSAWGAGFGLGWLSAHALVERPVSLLALEVLRVLIEPSLPSSVEA